VHADDDHTRHRHRDWFVIGSSWPGCGADQPVGFTSAWTHWRFFGEPQSLPNADRVLGGLCDLRLLLTLTEADCGNIAGVIRAALTD
jgi:hypothetical protein